MREDETLCCLNAACRQGSDKEDREFCAGLPVAVASPWIERLRHSLGPDAPSDEGVSAETCTAVDGTAAEGGMDALKDDAPPAALAVAVLDAELEAMTMSKAASYGLPEAWVARLTRFDPVRRQARTMPRSVRSSPGAQQLRWGCFCCAPAVRQASSPYEAHGASQRQLPLTHGLAASCSLP